jgi:hypothetical protein
MLKKPTGTMSPSTKTKLTELAEAGVSIGTSSWKYPGWCGQLYDEQRYLKRKKFSKAKFEATTGAASWSPRSMKRASSAAADLYHVQPPPPAEDSSSG